MRRFRLITTVVALASLALASSVWAAETTRTEYKEAAEPICRADTKANERILSSVRKEVKEGKLKPAAVKFAKASSALEAARGELEKIPRPAADEARLTQWFAAVKLEAELFAQVGDKLHSGDKADAQRRIAKLYSNANKANLQVLPFGFRYCRLEPSKFT
jgi:hypothetical protein